MFGMEKNKKDKQPNKTVFNLEETLKNNPKKKKELIKDANEKMKILKSMLREGHTNPKQFDEVALLLHGYNAMVNVINRIK